jgi:hypothetical protein
LCSQNQFQANKHHKITHCSTQQLSPANIMTIQTNYELYIEIVERPFHLASSVDHHDFMSTMDESTVGHDYDDYDDEDDDTATFASLSEDGTGGMVFYFDDDSVDLARVRATKRATTRSSHETYDDDSLVLARNRGMTMSSETSMIDTSSDTFVTTLNDEVAHSSSRHAPISRYSSRGSYQMECFDDQEGMDEIIIPLTGMSDHSKVRPATDGSRRRSFQRR